MNSLALLELYHHNAPPLKHSTAPVRRYNHGLNLVLVLLYACGYK